MRFFLFLAAGRKTKKPFLLLFAALFFACQLSFAGGKGGPSLARESPRSLGARAQPVLAGPSAPHVAAFSLKGLPFLFDLLGEGASIYLSINFPFPLQWEYFNGAQGYAPFGWDSSFSWGWAVGVDLTAFFPSGWDSMPRRIPISPSP